VRSRSARTDILDRLYAMLIEEFLELKRDHWAIFRLVVPLVMQLITYGYAAECRPPKG
jgi:ABC-2 type transport system permease protein